MKNKLFTTLALFFASMVFLATNAISQCVIPITEGQNYTEDFESGQMVCWTVEATGSGTWDVMTGTASNVVAFQNAAVGDEARLVSPTFDMSSIGSATFNFSYAMMGFYNADELTVSYRTSESDPWHDLGTYSFSDWSNTYEESFALQNLTSTYQISFLGHGNGGYYIFIDNIEIVGAGGCARPVSLEVSNRTPFSALLGWSTTGNEEHWTLELNNQQLTVDTQPFLMEGLEPQTEYTFRVKADCGGGLESDWSLPLTFKTLCDVITVTDEEPYFDDFEASEDFVCWQNEIEAGEDGWVIDPGYLFPNNTAFFIWMGQIAKLISAPLDLSAVTHPTLTFRHKQLSGELTVDELSVWYGTSDSDYWHLLAEYPYPTDDWETVTLELPDPSAHYYIAFQAHAHDAQGVYVDDVWVGNTQGVGLVETLSVTAILSPNPASNKVAVTANVAEGIVDIFDCLGKKIATVPLHEGNALLNLDDFAKGIYMARITNEKGCATLKLVKE